MPPNVLADELPSHYQCLDVGLHASPEELRSAYRRAALRSHPDKGGDPTSFLRVVQAFEVLSDPAVRHKYNLSWGIELYPSGTTGNNKSRSAEDDTAESCDHKRSRKDKSSGKPADQKHSSDHVLDSLYLLLKGAPREERPDLIKLLPHGLRAMLLKRFETSKHDQEVSCMDVAAFDDDSSSSGMEDEEENDMDTRPMKTIEYFPKENFISGVSSAASGRGASRVRGICKKSNQGGRPLYQAMVVISTLCIRSKLYLDVEDAIECHIVLLAGRQKVSQDSYSSVFDFNKSMRQHFSEDCLRFGIRFSVQVCSRRLIGRHLYSPETSDMDSALQSRSILLEGVAGGWPRLRQAWIQVQQSQKNSCRPARSHHDLEEQLRRWEEDDSMRRAKSELHAQQRAARLRARRASRVQSLVARQKLLCQAKTRQRDELSKARLRWHRRKDLTMEQILQGPPI